MKEYQHLIGTIIIAVAIIVAAVIIAGAIDGAGEAIRGSLFQLGDVPDNFRFSGILLRKRTVCFYRKMFYLIIPFR